MPEPVDLEQYLRGITSEMSRYDAFAFVCESLPSASGSWIARIIGCHASLVNRYLSLKKEWRCQRRSRKRYEKKSR